MFAENRFEFFGKLPQLTFARKTHLITILSAVTVVLNLLTVWTLALPLGRRFSVDAWLKRRRDKRRYWFLVRVHQRLCAKANHFYRISKVAHWRVDHTTTAHSSCVHFESHSP
jgi:hypothetical protein